MLQWTLRPARNGRRSRPARYRPAVEALEDRRLLDHGFVQTALVSDVPGLAPNTDWLKGTVELSSRGEIIVDAKGQTTVPGIFAAGDATTVPYKQIIIAMGEGAKASLSAFDHLIRA